MNIKKQLGKYFFHIQFITIPLFILIATLYMKKVPPLYTASVFLLPGVFFFMLILNIQEIKTSTRNYRGVKAVIMGSSGLIFCSAFSLPYFLRHFNIYISNIKMVIYGGFFIAALLPHFIVYILDKIDKKPRKNRIKHWIQFSDFNSKEGDEVSYKKAVKMLDDFSWEKELFFKQEIESKKKEACPPGIGFTSEKGYIFHVLGMKLNVFRIYVDIPIKKKLFGSIPYSYRRRQESIELNRREIDQLLQYFYDKRYQEIIDYINRK